MTKASILAFLLLVLAVPASAAPIIATPPLDPDGGRVSCLVANVSETKTVEAELTVYDYNGNANFTATINLTPLKNTQTAAFPNDERQSHCRVKVLGGGKRNVRVALQVRSAGGDIVAAVNGH